MKDKETYYIKNHESHGIIETTIWWSSVTKKWYSSKEQCERDIRKFKLEKLNAKREFN